MITFDKLVIISENKYSIRTDEISDLKTIFNKLSDINTTVVLVLKHGEDKHTIDFGKLLLNNIGLLDSGNITNVISSLTPEMIYTYHTSLFYQTKIIRTFMNSDLPGDTSVSPYNIAIDETTNTIYDPSYRDMVISCEEYDLNKVIPIINGKLRNCGWGNKKIYLKDMVDLVPSINDITFISFGDTVVSTKSLSELALSGWIVDDNTTTILVLDGSMYYDTPYMYSVDKRINKLALNSVFVMSEFKRRGFNTIDELIENKNSFVIMVKTDRILVRDVSLITEVSDSGLLELKYFEQSDQDHHLDYICIDNYDYTIKGITIANEKYRNVTNSELPKARRVYADNGSGDLRLIQLTVC